MIAMSVPGITRRNGYTILQIFLVQHQHGLPVVRRPAFGIFAVVHGSILWPLGRIDAGYLLAKRFRFDSITIGVVNNSIAGLRLMLALDMATGLNVFAY